MRPRANAFAHASWRVHLTKTRARCGEPHLFSICQLGGVDCFVVSGGSGSRGDCAGSAVAEQSGIGVSVVAATQIWWWRGRDARENITWCSDYPHAPHGSLRQRLAASAAPSAAAEADVWTQQHVGCSRIVRCLQFNSNGRTLWRPPAWQMQYCEPSLKLDEWRAPWQCAGMRRWSFNIRRRWPDCKCMFTFCVRKVQVLGIVPAVSALSGFNAVEPATMQSMWRFWLVQEGKRWLQSGRSGCEQSFN